MFPFWCNNSGGGVWTVDKVTEKKNQQRGVGMAITLLDMLPVANLLNIICLGMLFVVAKFGNQGLYCFVDINFKDPPHNH